MRSPRARDALNRTTTNVLVDRGGTRSHREAPKIDGGINVPSGAATRYVPHREDVAATGPALDAQPSRLRGDRPAYRDASTPALADAGQRVELAHLARAGSVRVDLRSRRDRVSVVARLHARVLLA